MPTSNDPTINQAIPSVMASVDDQPPVVSPTPNSLPPVMAVKDSLPKYHVSPKGRRFVATLFGLLILVGGLSTGGYLVQQQQLIQQKASEDPCLTHTTAVLCDADDTNGCSWYLCNNSCHVTGTPNDDVCDPSATTSTTLSCREIKAYDFNWVLLTTSGLKSLKPGDRIYLTVTGEPTTESFDKARFSINGGAWIEVGSENKKAGTTTEFWYLYTIPSNNNSFKVEAQVHSVELNTWI
jgi:hypothetical protein